MKSMLALLALAASAAGDYTSAALNDQITDLPGLAFEYKTKMFSGYIDVGAGKKMFYWHVESEQASQATDPLVMWTNGGPGCSGVSGFMTEQGPFRPTADGKLVKNAYHWNQVANMIFIEQPAGVGFSQAPSGTQYGDHASAVDMHTFLLGFLERFPAYNQNKLYISSESYGGHYMPALADYIVKQHDLPNFSGVFLGNPLTYMPYRNYGQWATMNNHGMIPLPLWEQYVAKNCRNATNADCDAIENKMSGYSAHMNMYGLDFPVCTSDVTNGLRGHEEMRQMSEIVARANGKKPLLGGSYFPGSYAPCVSDYADAYLNQQEVRDAIHAVSVAEKRWSMCSNEVGSHYSMHDVNQDVRPVWQFLQQQGLDIVIYSGDDDAMCATAGTQALLWDMAGEVKSAWAQWLMDGQVGGFIVKFNGLSFATVHGAGHMVPSTRPGHSLYLLSEFLQGNLN
eukprot:TRINITY_DN1216_c0_g1_i1.p1 TRINITY_DN1216_c0_g1~~TRINITY_DN1216_c0_g1_i1.p1  ORF type:complete len:454 (+),score=159.68 TRINITY_DN1216_c0_g1_i1:49-1410(+)